ncbi:MAG: 2-dehydropantoate 2-reductase [Anaerolineales bacterium]|nr:2-dehydropantoate 2-reductase [Anaerolineales bacterium]
MVTEILIVGIGAMALLLGGRLAAAGIKVTLLGTWQEGIKAIRESGVRIRTSSGEVSYPVFVTDDPREINKSLVSLVLVKSWQTERAANQLQELIFPESIVLSLQNGLGNLEILKDALGEKQTALGVTTYGATLVEPGVVRPGGEGVITLGSHPRLGGLKASFQEAGLSVEETTDISSLVWSKLVINVGINPLTALMGVKYGELLKSIAARTIMRSAAEEAVSVAIKKGIHLVYENPIEAVEKVAAATAGNISSMLQDVNRGAPTEIDSICGAIVQEGKQVNVPTPVNELLQNLVRSKVDLSGRKDENS